MLIRPQGLLCIDWEDFTTGIAFMGFITTCGSTISYAVLYHCPTCLWDWLVVIVGIIFCVLYFVEFVMDKCDGSRSIRYLASAPGLFKILEACVSCTLFVLLGNYDRKPIVVWCYVSYILPFLVIPVVIMLNVLKKMRDFQSAFQPDLCGVALHPYFYAAVHSHSNHVASLLSQR